MEAWSNIEISQDDTEIPKINELERSLGNQPEKVRKIRELITRFEVCHFKYRHHFDKIIDSISCLDPVTEPENIGENHLHKGKGAWKKDRTGRSLVGQQYLWSIERWLCDKLQFDIPEYFNHTCWQNTKKWLGDKNPEKERLVRLLKARLTWDWEMYRSLLQKDPEGIELQVCSTDICHYAFPANLCLLLKGIGKLKPARKFEGCGSFDEERKSFIQNKLLVVNELSKQIIEAGNPDKNDLIKVWLFICLAKTIKEQVSLKEKMNFDFLNTIG